MDLKNVIYIDSSGADSLGDLVRTSEQNRVRLVLCGLNHQPLDIARRSGLLQRIARENVFPDLASGIRAALSANACAETGRSAWVAPTH